MKATKFRDSSEYSQCVLDCSQSPIFPWDRRCGSDVDVVQSLNSTFFPPHMGAKPGRAKEESESGQDNLHAHAHNEPIKNY